MKEKLKLLEALRERERESGNLKTAKILIKNNKNLYSLLYSNLLRSKLI